MMETMLMNPATNVALGSIFVLLVTSIVAIVFSGSMMDAPESPRIEKVKLKIESITYNQGEELYLVQIEKIGPKIIPQRNLEIEYINEEEEMCLEKTQITPIYIQKRWFRKDKMWQGRPTTTYKLYVVKEKISTVCRKRLYCTLQ